MNTRLSEEQLRAIIQRAAELQQETERDRTASLVGDPDAMDRLLSDSDESGKALYSAEMVVQAAREVGISPDSVALAALDLASAGSGDPIAWQRGVDRASAFLACPERRLEIERTVAVRPSVLLASLRAVCAQSAFNLTLDSLHGRNPVEDGVLRYEFTDSWWTNESPGKFRMRMLYADLKEILVTVRPVAGNPDSAVLRLHSPLGRALRLNHRVALACAGLLGASGAAGIGLLAVSALGPLAIPVAAVAGVASASASLVGYRPLFRWQLKKGSEALEQLAKAVASHALTDSGLSASGGEGRSNPI